MCGVSPGRRGQLSSLDVWQPLGWSLQIPHPDPRIHRQSGGPVRTGQEGIDFHLPDSRMALGELREAQQELAEQVHVGSGLAPPGRVDRDSPSTLSSTMLLWDLPHLSRKESS